MKQVKQIHLWTSHTLYKNESFHVITLANCVFKNLAIMPVTCVLCMWLNERILFIFAHQFKSNCHSMSFII